VAWLTWWTREASAAGMARRTWQTLFALKTVAAFGTGEASGAERTPAAGKANRTGRSYFTAESIGAGSPT